MLPPAMPPRDEEEEWGATVWIPVPPLRRRLVVLGFVAAAVTAMLVSAYEATWFTANVDGRNIDLGLRQLWGGAGLTRTDGLFDLVVLVLHVLVGIPFMLRLGYMGVRRLIDIISPTYAV